MSSACTFFPNFRVPIKHQAAKKLRPTVTPRAQHRPRVRAIAMLNGWAVMSFEIIGHHRTAPHATGRSRKLCARELLRLALPIANKVTGINLQAQPSGATSGWNSFDDRFFLNDPALPQASLTFAGRIVPAIELSPRAAFFVAGQRGRGNRAAIEIVNHESEPLTIEKIEHPTERFTTQLETLKRGQHYRLTLALNPDGPGGQTADTIVIRTSSKRTPVLKVGANTYLYEKVHTFPDVVDFGTWRVAEAGHAAVILMIHQERGSDFRVQLSSDVPGLSFKSERGLKGDRYQVEITLISEQIRVGPMKGSIIIGTNDPEFPRVVVPVSGQIVER